MIYIYIFFFQVGTLLRKPMNQNSKRAIKTCIEEEIPKSGAKYMNLLNGFEEKLRFY